MRIIEDVKLDFSDVLIQPKRSTLKSRSDVDLNRTYTFRNSGKSYTGVPIMASNMDGVGTTRLALALADHRMFTCLTKHLSLEELVTFFMSITEYDSFNTLGSPKLIDSVAYSLGTGKEDIEKYLNFLNAGCTSKYLVVDVANGYTESFIDSVKMFRDISPESVIIAGNVCTPEIVEELILAGADVIKVGIGPGNACSTRIQTGVGYPQLSAIIECADAAHGLKGHIVADGGINCPGDIAKAFGAGADFVMMGTYFAGHDEGGGDIIKETYETNEIERIDYVPVTKTISPLEMLGYTGLHSNTVVSTQKAVPVFKQTTKKFVEFYGMSSKKAQEAHGSGLKEYRASEGRVLKVPYKGSVDDTVKAILGGLRSACTYVGAQSLKELSKRTTFIKVNRQVSTLHGLGELNS